MYLPVASHIVDIIIISRKWEVTCEAGDIQLDDTHVDLTPHAITIINHMSYLHVLVCNNHY